MKKSDKKLIEALPKEDAKVVNVVNMIAGRSRKTNYLEAIEKLLFKTLENAASVKFLIFVTASVFFYIGKLSEGAWQETVLVIAGLRAVNEVAAMYKKPTSGASAESEKDA